MILSRSNGLSYQRWVIVYLIVLNVLNQTKMRKIVSINKATEVNDLVVKVGLYGYNILTNHIIGKNEDDHFFSAE